MVDDASGPEASAERVALWRALHVQFDAAPHVLDDDLGLQLAARRRRFVVLVHNARF